MTNTECAHRNWYILPRGPLLGPGDPQVSCIDCGQTEPLREALTRLVGRVTRLEHATPQPDEACAHRDWMLYTGPDGGPWVWCRGCSSQVTGEAAIRLLVERLHRAELDLERLRRLREG